MRCGVVGMLCLGAMIVLLATACGGESPSTPAPRVQVVATTSILADLVKNVGGNRVEVHSIVPPGADVHSFQTTPQDSIAISRAVVIISNGLGLDAPLDPIINSAKRADAIHVVAAEGLDAQPKEEMGFSAGEYEDTHEAQVDHAYSRGDPHLWQNPLFAIHYVERIRDGLVQADPGNASVYQDNADTYNQRLRQLDQEIVQTLDQVPMERRHLVTFHDAFGYFAERYGWRLSAFVPSDASVVTPERIVTVMERIGEEGIPAVFVEPQFSPQVMEQAARDTGVSVGTIYSLADDNVPTYIDMMRFNARSLAGHLR